MKKPSKTGFDKYFDGRMKNASFASAYAQARAEIDSVDGFMRALEAARKASGLSKAALARRAHTQPEAVRRLFTMETPNPTLSTVMNLVGSMGYSLTLVPSASAARKRQANNAA